MIPRTRKLKLKNQARRIKKVITNLTFKNRKSYLTEIQKNAKVKKCKLGRFQSKRAVINESRIFKFGSNFLMKIDYS